MKKYILQNTNYVDIILHTRNDYQFEKGKNYNEGDDIDAKEVINAITIISPNLDHYGNVMSYSKIVLGENEIKELLEKIKGVEEKPTFIGKYSELPF